jgi:hypothetical protein
MSMSQGSTLEHLYKVGQLVSCEAPLGTKPLNACTVTAVLPPLGSQLQYRIKSQHEAFERVVLEYQLGAL